MLKNKKKGGLPDLPDTAKINSPPSLKGYPEMEDNLESQEIHELPSFPDSPMKNGFSQAAIKDAVTTGNPSPENIETEPHEKNFKLTEMEEWTPPDFPQEKEVETDFERPLSPEPVKRISENKPVYIRLDKFKSAKNSLDKIKIGLDEIEELLKQLRDVKSKEDQELLSWEKEMDNIKSRMNNITSDIFDRAEI